MPYNFLLMFIKICKMLPCIFIHKYLFGRAANEPYMLCIRCDHHRSKSPHEDWAVKEYNSEGQQELRRLLVMKEIEEEPKARKKVVISSGESKL